MNDNPPTPPDSVTQEIPLLVRISRTKDNSSTRDDSTCYAVKSPDVVILDLYDDGDIVLLVEKSGKQELFELTPAATAALRKELEQAQVQLAGCLTAAEGGTSDPAKQGDYGWSLAYQKTLDLRTRLDAAQKECQRLNEIINGAFPETAALHELLDKAGCESVSKETLVILRATIAAQSAELDTLRAVLALVKQWAFNSTGVDETKKEAALETIFRLTCEVPPAARHPTAP